MILSHQTHRAVERSPMCNALVKIFSPSWSSDSHTCLAVLYFSPSLLALSLPLTYFSICKYLSSIISLTRDLTVARCHCCPCNGIQGPSGQRSAHLCKNAGLLEASLWPACMSATFTGNIATVQVWRTSTRSARIRDWRGQQSGQWCMLTRARIILGQGWS